MTVENFDRTLNAFLNRVPFQPFTVALINGSRYEVDQPGAIVFRDGVAVHFAPAGVLVIVDHEGVSQFIGDLMGQENS